MTCAWEYELHNCAHVFWTWHYYTPSTRVHTMTCAWLEELTQRGLDASVMLWPVDKAWVQTTCTTLHKKAHHMTCAWEYELHNCAFWTCIWVWTCKSSQQDLYIRCAQEYMYWEYHTAQEWALQHVHKRMKCPTRPVHRKIPHTIWPAQKSRQHMGAHNMYECMSTARVPHHDLYIRHEYHLHGPAHASTQNMNYPRVHTSTERKSA